jgi:hypothetical protein
VVETPNGKTSKKLEYKYETMRKIQKATLRCESEKLHEPSWNDWIYSRMLRQILKSRSGFDNFNITSARVVEELVPANIYGEVLKTGMIDYAVTLGPPLLPEALVTQRLTASLGELKRTCNPSEYEPLCFKPVALSLQTIAPDGNIVDGRVQLAVWAMAYFNRLRQLFQSPVTVTLPMLLMNGLDRKLYFAHDLDEKIRFIKALDIGSTSNILGCYTISAALNPIFDWVEKTFVPWYLKGLESSLRLS